MTDDFAHGKTINYVTTFHAKFSVIEKDTSGYVVEWDYTDAMIAPNEVTIENDMLGALLNTKLLVKISLTGRFKELLNVDEVKIAADKGLEKLIASSGANTMRNISFKAAKQMLATKQGLEIALLKHVKFYNLSFGYNYTLEHEQINKLKYPSPVGGLPLDAIEKVQLTKLDHVKNSCVVERHTNVDGIALKSEIITYLKRASPKDGNDIEHSLHDEKLEFGESTMQQLDFSKGIVQKSNFTRKMNLGFQNRIVVLEVETTD